MFRAAARPLLLVRTNVQVCWGSGDSGPSSRVPQQGSAAVLGSYDVELRTDEVSAAGTYAAAAAAAAMCVFDVDQFQFSVSPAAGGSAIIH